MNARRKSDGRVVPVTSANNDGPEPSAESIEERRPARRNIGRPNLDRTSKPEHRRSRGLFGVRETAKHRRDLRFSNLLHHITPELLMGSFHKLRKSAAVGLDGVSWHEYEQDLEDRITDLHGRIHRKAFRATPSKRVYIEKSDGRKRPLGIPSLEDKIVQQCLRTILECTYEEDFLGFSYGFRPQRSQHQALDALAVGIDETRVNWVLDADIEGFFDNIDRDWLMQFIDHRIGDKRIVRLILKFLNAGIIEGTDWSDNGRGTPQGSVLSPLLANVFLHYVFDLWINHWRQHYADGAVIVVRYADDFVIGFEHEADARKCLAALHQRLDKFGLNLHPQKTRLIEFGRGSSLRREREGRGKCETFDFLGFTHACGKTRKRKRFKLIRITMASRLRRTLTAIREQLRRRRHHDLGQVGRWLWRVVRGWRWYYAVPGNYVRLKQFDDAVCRLWLQQIRRRSQRGRNGWTWKRMGRVFRRYIPRPKILHEYPDIRHHARLRARAV